MAGYPSAARFPTTHWTRVARAGGAPTPEARAALAELFGAYWYPIYALIRRKGHDADAALDLTQNYFTRVLEKGTVAAPRAAVAAGLGMTEANLRVALHPLRARFAAGLRREVAATLRDAGGVSKILIRPL